MTHSRHFPRVLVLGALLLSLGVAGAEVVGAAQPAASDPMRIIPADVLFCVRLNRLTTTLDQVDKFLADVAPVGLSVAARSQLARFLGAAEPAGINLAGDFAAFGPLPGGEKPDLKRVGVLIPLSDFSQFLTNPNVTKPDAQGILKIGAVGNQSMAGVQMSNYLLLTSVAHQQALTEAKNWTSGASTGSLAQRLSPDDLKRATGAPVWACANVQVAAKMYGPTIQQKLKDATKTLQQMQAKGGPVVGPPEAVMNIWTSLLNSFLQEAQSISLSIDPTATAIRLTPILAAVPNTDMAKILSLSGTQQSQPSLIGYTENGAITTGVATLSPAFLRSITLKRIDLLTTIMGPSMSQENIARIKKLGTDSADALGGAFAWSFVPDLKDKPPFRLRYVANIKDRQKLSDALDQSFKMVSEGPLADLLRKFGLKMQFEVKRSAETYKEVPIDAIHVSMQSTDENPSQGQMIETIFPEGLNLRFALTNDLFLYTFGAEPDKDIHALIDQAKAGAPGQVPSEVQAARQLTPEAKTADFFGTYNYVRAIQMALLLVPMPLPSVEAATQSSIAFAGNLGDGRLLIDIAVPKQQVQEVMGVIMRMQQQMPPSQQKQPGQPGAQPPTRSPGQT